ncbi:hypothetical protein PG291_06300 [Riemerella anatipestifer]|nr:hypothetical protein [Riemerella anatipestifer]
MEILREADGIKWASEWRVLLGFGYSGNGTKWKCGKLSSEE